ncbi:MAG: hypothetical protein QG635_2002 [Bacteroidota bacterium]|nr:hypothetical protein [Bacteroidota bacterium]
MNTVAKKSNAKHVKDIIVSVVIFASIGAIIITGIML